MRIHYQVRKDYRGFDRPPDLVQSVIENHGCKSILEVGSGANPSLGPEYVRARHLRYVTNDLSEEELTKADAAFDRLVMDFAGEIDPALYGQFDLVFSQMVSEHIHDGRRFHENIFKVLKPGGLAVHYLPCLGALPFMTNRVLPSGLTARLLRFFNPRDEMKKGKFKAYYSWALGPTRGMIGRFRSVGFEIVEYIGCYGHDYYRRRLRLLDNLEEIKSKMLVRYPVPWLCSYVTVFLRKPV